MTITLAFDVYGTLIDTHGVVVALEQYLGEKAKEFSVAWRQKQLEYSFRRGLMGKFDDFSICTWDALEYTCTCFKVPLDQNDKEALMGTYAVLPAFDDALEGLQQARKAGFRMLAFSNGGAQTINRLLTNAGLRNFLTGVVSVEEVQSFKPDPEVYKLFLKKAETRAGDAWLISGNPFDVIGAISSGMKAAWVQRSPEEVFDPWGIEPTVTVQNLSQLVAKISL